MRTTNFQRVLVMCLIILSTSARGSWAAACDSTVLPAQIKTALQTEFESVGWKIVTPELLTSPDDRKIWDQNYSRECPGVISGHFTGEKVGYAINLVKGAKKGLEQQIVFFAPTREGFRKLILSPSMQVATVSVLRKFAPGTYRSPDSGHSVKVGFDTIGLSVIEGETIVYYWDGKGFQRIETSV
jgi:hypothetical protein